MDIVGALRAVVTGQGVISPVEKIVIALGCVLTICLLLWLGHRELKNQDKQHRINAGID